MSKSVLVMVTPKSCNSCDLCGGTFRCFCRVNRRDIEDLSIRPDWCPLRPLPEKDIKSYFPDGFEDGYTAGWNACIDEITGGEVDGEINKKRKK